MILQHIIWSVNENIQIYFRVYLKAGADCRHALLKDKQAPLRKKGRHQR